MRREQEDESVRQASSDDASARRGGEPGSVNGPLAAAEGAPAIGTRGGDRPTSPPNARAMPADEWDGNAAEALGRDLDSENS